MICAQQVCHAFLVAAADPERAANRLSASYLVALAAHLVSEVGDLGRRADLTGKRLATLSLDTQVRFRSAADAPGGRAYRLIVAAHPLPTAATQQEEA